MRSRRRKVVSLAVIIAAIGIGGLCLRLRPLSLLERAVGLPCRGPAFAWASGRSVVLPVEGGNPSSVAWRIDLATGVQSTLGEVHKSNTSGGGNQDQAVSGGGGWTTSPNGKWLAYVLEGGFYSYRETSAFAVLETNGNRKFRFDGDGQSVRPPEIAWLPDSRRFLLSVWSSNGYHVLMYSLDAPDQKAIPLKLPSTAASVLGVTPDYQIVATDFVRQPAKPVKAVTIFTVGFFPHFAPPQRFRIPLPPDTELREIALSPQGDRLAWTTDRHQVSPILQFFARRLPTFFHGSPIRHTTILYVTDLKGTSFHEVGTQEITPKQEPGPADIRWTPDGKRLGFLLNENLYTVPVE